MRHSLLFDRTAVVILVLLFAVHHCKTITIPPTLETSSSFTTNISKFNTTISSSNSIQYCYSNENVYVYFKQNSTLQSYRYLTDQFSSASAKIIVNDLSVSRNGEIKLFGATDTTFLSVNQLYNNFNRYATSYGAFTPYILYFEKDHMKPTGSAFFNNDVQAWQWFPNLHQDKVILLKTLTTVQYNSSSLLSDVLISNMLDYRSSSSQTHPLWRQFVYFSFSSRQNTFNFRDFISSWRGKIIGNDLFVSILSLNTLSSPQHVSSLPFSQTLEANKYHALVLLFNTNNGSVVNTFLVTSSSPITQHFDFNYSTNQIIWLVDSNSTSVITLDYGIEKKTEDFKDTNRVTLAIQIYQNKIQQVRKVSILTSQQVENLAALENGDAMIQLSDQFQIINLPESKTQILFTSHLYILQNQSNVMQYLFSESCITKPYSMKSVANTSLVYLTSCQYEEETYRCYLIKVDASLTNSALQYRELFVQFGDIHHPQLCNISFHLLPQNDQIYVAGSTSCYFNLLPSVTAGVLFNTVNSFLLRFYEQCTCENKQCLIPICNHRLALDSQFVCQGRGLCVDADSCDCLTNAYYGDLCQNFFCYGVQQDSPTVCNSRGNCVGPNDCQCVTGFGNQCERFDCFGIISTDINTCSHSGICVNENFCNCTTGYTGSNCEKKETNYLLEEICDMGYYLQQTNISFTNLQFGAINGTTPIGSTFYTLSGTVEYAIVVTPYQILRADLGTQQSFVSYSLFMLPTGYQLVDIRHNPKLQQVGILLASNVFFKFIIIDAQRQFAVKEGKAFLLRTYVVSSRIVVLENRILVIVTAFSSKTQTIVEQNCRIVLIPQKNYLLVFQFNSQTLDCQVVYSYSSLNINYISHLVVNEDETILLASKNAIANSFQLLKFGNFERNTQMALWSQNIQLNGRIAFISSDPLGNIFIVFGSSGVSFHLTKLDSQGFEQWSIVLDSNIVDIHSINTDVVNSVILSALKFSNPVLVSAMYKYDLQGTLFFTYEFDFYALGSMILESNFNYVFVGRPSADVKTIDLHQHGLNSTLPSGSENMVRALLISFKTSECTLCPKGSIKHDMFAKNCTFCSAGTYAKNETQTCEVCGVGTYSKARSIKCTPCPFGQYTDQESSSSCQYCSLRLTLTTGATSSQCHVANMLLLGSIALFIFLSILLLCLVIVLSKYTVARRYQMSKFDRALRASGEQFKNLITLDSSLMQIKFDEIDQLKEIGGGGSGSIVFKGIWKYNRVAIKVFRFTSALEESLSSTEFENEMKLLASIKHPNIVSCYGFVVDVPRIGIVLEYCDKGSLSHVLKRETLSWQLKISIAKDICNAMMFLHSKNIIHRDLKSQNVLCDNHFTAKVSDFGLSKYVKEQQQMQNMTKLVGTSYYMSPQITLGLPYDHKTDVFSFGVILFELLINEPIKSKHFYYTMDEEVEEKSFINSEKKRLLFKSKHSSSSSMESSSEELVYNIEILVAQNENFRPIIPEKIMQSLQHEKISLTQAQQMQKYIQIMQQCWKQDPSARPEFSSMYEEFSNFI